MPLTRLALVLLYTACNGIGDVLLSRGMKMAPVGAGWVAGGILVLASGFGLFLRLLRRLPLSVVLPANAGSYLVIAALSVLLLREPVSPARWAGTLLVSAGIGLVVLSESRDARPTG